MTFDRLLPPLIAVIVGVVLAGAGVYWARLIFNRSMGDTGATEPFTLQDLREMLKRGEITEAEFETMRAGIIGATRGDKRRPAPPNAPPAEPDR